MFEILLFWVSFIIASVTGTLMVTEISSIDSNNLEPSSVISYDFPCPPYDGELCWIHAYDNYWETGP